MCKLDISKAFDKLDWHFLFKALKSFNFHASYVELIKECVCFSHGSVLINGDCSGYVALACSLRKGNPLSPFLFILAQGFLSLNISKLVNVGTIKPIFFISTIRPIFHLMFVDDILIFSRAIPSSANVLAKLFSLY